MRTHSRSHPSPMKTRTIHNFFRILACAAALHLPEIGAAERPGVPPVSEERVRELRNLRWGMFICWSFSTFSGKEWTPGVTDVALLQGHRLRHRPVGAHGQGGRHGLHPVPHQAPRRLLPLGHEDHRPQGDQGPAGPRRARRAAEVAATSTASSWRSTSPRATGPGPAPSTARAGKAGGGRNPEMKKAQLQELLTAVRPDRVHLVRSRRRRRRPEPRRRRSRSARRSSPAASSASTTATRQAPTSASARWAGPARSTITPAAGPHMKDAPSKSYRLAEFTYPILPPHKGGAMWFYSLPEARRALPPGREALRGLPRRGEVRQHLLARRRPGLRRPAARDRRADAAQGRRDDPQGSMTSGDDQDHRSLSINPLAAGRSLRGIGGGRWSWSPPHCW